MHWVQSVQAVSYTHLEEKAQAIWRFFLAESADHIFSRYFIDTKDESGTKMPIFNGPSGYHGWGGNTPVQDLVDAFAMEDGSKFDWKNSQHANKPYGLSLIHISCCLSYSFCLQRYIFYLCSLNE